MKKLYSTAVVLALLASCSTVDIDKPPIMITPNNSADSVGIDVYARQRARGNPVPSFRGQDTIQVRAFGNRSGGGYGEIQNAVCNLDSGLFTANFATPANIVVPDYGPNSPALFIRCEYEGRTKSVTVNSANKTAQERSSTAASSGLLGMLIIGAVNESVRNNETDDFGYGDFNGGIRVEIPN